jgi:hypothetical protein
MAFYQEILRNTNGKDLKSGESSRSGFELATSSKQAENVTV